MRCAKLDTELGSGNLGDSIIAQSIYQNFPELLALPSIATHQFMGYSDAIVARKSQLLVVLGTNFISSRMYPPAPWRFGPVEWAVTRRKLVGIGVGARSYEQGFSLSQKINYRSMFFPGIPVATRDQYSANLLQGIGIDAISTGCPTMWNLSQSLPTRTSETEVVVTLTDYAPDPENDNTLLEMLSKMFVKVHFWPQGTGDLKYLSSLRQPRNLVVSPSGLDNLNKLLHGRVYVGTRLHAAIRASQLGQPALVLGIDNRAKEIASDTNYPIIGRAELAEGLDQELERLRDKRLLRRNDANIHEFKQQLNRLMETKQL
jgi:polysaccharide pyruvyl transferase WcaK-like protein